MKLRLTVLMLTWLAYSGCEPSGAPEDATVEPVSYERAEALFLEHCAICHGERGDGRGVRRGSLHRRPPDFRRPSFAEGRSAASIRHSISRGIPGSDMPAWKSLDDREIAGLAEYVLSFSSRDADH